MCPPSCRARKSSACHAVRSTPSAARLPVKPTAGAGAATATWATGSAATGAHGTAAASAATAAIVSGSAAHLRTSLLGQTPTERASPPHPTLPQPQHTHSRLACPLTTSRRHEPTKLHGLEGVHVASVACGWRHSAAVDQQGRVYTCGWSKYGQLGHGDCSDALVSAAWAGASCAADAAAYAEMARGGISRQRHGGTRTGSDVPAVWCSLCVRALVPRQHSGSALQCTA
jgi:hypothetical protein